MTDTATPGRSARLTLTLLVLVYTVHIIDRQVIGIVLEPIKREFDLSDARAGLVGGTIHSLALCLTVTPLGWLADRVNRTRLLSGLVLIWSSVTFLSGLASNYIGLLLARGAVGAAEGGSQPLCMSLIADYFPRHQRSTAVGFLYMGGGIGAFLLFLGGGFVVTHYGWQAGFFIAGIPGLLLAIATFAMLRDPPRGRYDEQAIPQAPAPVLTVVGFVLATPQLRNVMFGATMAVVVSSSLWTWTVPFYMRKFNLSPSEAGAIMALTFGIVQAIGYPVFGRIADTLSSRREGNLLLVPMLAMLAMLPASALALLSPSLPFSIIGIFGAGLATAAWTGTSFGAKATLAPSHMRGTVTGIGALLTNFGAAAGPGLTGLLSDGFGGSDSLVWALLTVTMLDGVAALFLWRAMRAMRAGGDAGTGSSGRPPNSVAVRHMSH